MVTQEMIKGAIASYLAANNALDLESFVNAFAEDAALYNVAEISPLVGQEAVRRVAEQSLAPFQKMQVKPERIFITGNGAALFYSGQATLKNGREMHLEGIDVFEINEPGKIQSVRFYLDMAAVMALADEGTAVE